MSPTTARFSLTGDASWDRITQAAKEQCSAQLIERQSAVLELGSLIAWGVTAKVSSPTDHFSSVHVVGAPVGNQAATCCGQVIPDPVLWFPLTPALARAMAPCGFCEAALARDGAGLAA